MNWRSRGDLCLPAKHTQPSGEVCEPSEEVIRSKTGSEGLSGEMAVWRARELQRAGRKEGRKGSVCVGVCV